MELKKSFNKFKYSKFNPSVNEWPSSVYSFNKNNLNTLWTNNITFDIINNYFNIYKNIDRFNNFFYPYKKKISKRFSLKRIFVGLPEIKISLNNVNILVYIFNKENENLILEKKLKFLKKIFLTNNKIDLSRKYYKSLDIKSSKKRKNIQMSKLYLKKKVINWQKTKNILYSVKTNLNLNFLSLNNIYRKWFLKQSIKYNTEPFHVKDLIENTRILFERKNYIRCLYQFYLYKLYCNKLKFHYFNIFNLNKILYKLYNKRVNIKVVTLKYLHLDNSLFVEAIVRKLKNRNRKILKVLRKALILPKIPKIDSMFLFKQKKSFISTLYKLTTFDEGIKKNVRKVIFRSLKSIHITGVRLEGKGRLTRRLTASRAVFKKAYVGNLKNVYSSSKGLSAMTSRGFDRSNLNYINLNSYNRNGSYGIKSWQNTI